MNKCVVGVVCVIGVVGVIDVIGVIGVVCVVCVVGVVTVEFCPCRGQPHHHCIITLWSPPNDIEL